MVKFMVRKKKMKFKKNLSPKRSFYGKIHPGSFIRMFLRNITREDRII
jgi:hypothetical protein